MQIWQYWVSNYSNAFSMAGIELLGTFLLILLGNGIVATCVLNGTKGKGSGWLTIAFGWFGALFISVMVTFGIANSIQGLKATGFMNPIFVINDMIKLTQNHGTTLIFGTPIIDGLLIILFQAIGAALGQISIMIIFKKQYDETKEETKILSTFSTSPERKSNSTNLFAEAIATFVLVLAISTMMKYDGAGAGDSSSSMGIFVGISIFAIIVSIGSTTGCSLNPTRDLIPRLIHQISSKKILLNKGNSNWSYSWIPVVGPFIGGILGLIVSPGLFY